MRRLMLVASHKSANLAENVKICFNKLCIKKCVYSDSTKVLHWLKDNEEYKPLVSNSVSKNKRKKNYRTEICSY